MAGKVTNQSNRVLDHMIRYGSITQLEALTDLGVMRLASRISDLKKRGYHIATDWVDVVNRYGETCRVKRYSVRGRS